MKDLPVIDVAEFVVLVAASGGVIDTAASWPDGPSCAGWVAVRSRPLEVAGGAEAADAGLLDSQDAVEFAGQAGDECRVAVYHGGFAGDRGVE
ncbi:hypothetical protein [Saccharopolyspora shandongensis]|uniref:hypothetical protein n=1 Tax=Saccharopolyspora shandongensis TaxID=418495 RepID=UPI0033DBA185